MSSANILFSTPPPHRFALLRFKPVRTEAVAQDPFVPEEGALDPGLLPVADLLLPRLPSDLGNPLEMPA